jgi:predicted Zn finger-like uncharacterized protein
MSKVRIVCPECSSALLVDPHLIGKEGKCPRCQHAFTLQEQPPAEQPPETADDPEEDPFEGGFDVGDFDDGPPLLTGKKAKKKNKGKALPLPKRPALGIVALIIRALSLLQLVAAGFVLLAIVYSLFADAAGFGMVAFGPFLGLIVGAVVTYAYAELILIFIALEKLGTQIVNELRE